MRTADHPAALLFHGSPDAIAGIAVALRVRATAPLDIVIRLIDGLASAAQIREAFAAATRPRAFPVLRGWLARWFADRSW